MCGCKQGTCLGNCPCGCNHTPPTIGEQIAAAIEADSAQLWDKLIREGMRRAAEIARNHVPVAVDSPAADEAAAMRGIYVAAAHPEMVSVLVSTRDYLLRASENSVYDDDAAALAHLVSRAGGIAFALDAIAAAVPTSPTDTGGAWEALTRMVESERKSLPPKAHRTEVGHEAARWVDKLAALLAAHPAPEEASQ